MSMPDPIGASGPGPMSQRIDKQPMRAPTGLPYGDAAKLMEAQRGAPMAATPQPPSIPVTGLHEPTSRPDQPVTAGAPMGAGPGPEVLSATTAPVGGAVSQALARVAATDSSGIFAQLLAVAQQKGL